VKVADEKRGVPLWWYGVAAGLGIGAAAVMWGRRSELAGISPLATSYPAIGGGGGSRLEGGTYLFDMENGAFPNQTAAAVFVPRGYDPSKPLDLSIYFHGFGNCVENVLRDSDGRCRSGGPTHHSSHLAAQFEASGVNGVLVLPEIRREERTGDPGRFRQRGATAAFLHELLSVKLAPVLGARDIGSIRNICLMGHSGAYTAMAAVIQAGDVAGQLRDVCLVDALYGNSSVFGGWIRGDASGRRLVDAYTNNAGTAANSVSLASSLRGALGAGSFWWDDRDGADPQPQEIPRHGAVFKRSSLDHTAASRVWPRLLWASSPAFDQR
jgi:hypothetical protein